MKFSDYLKNQLTDFVEVYRKYFWKALTVSLIFSIFVFTLSLVFYFYNVSDKSEFQYQFQLVGFYFFRTSSGTYYYKLVYCTKILFVFFTSILSISILKFEKGNINSENALSFSSVIKSISFKNFILLFLGLIISFCIAYGLDFLNEYLNISSSSEGILRWFHSISFLLKIYSPLIIFSILVYRISNSSFPKISLKRLSLLFISVWLFNEFGYEMTSFFNYEILSLIKIPFKTPSSYFYFNSIVDIVMLSLLMIGYHSSMTKSLSLSENILHESKEISAEEMNTIHD